MKNIIDPENITGFFFVFLPSPGYIFTFFTNPNTGMKISSCFNLGSVQGVTYLYEYKYIYNLL